MLFSSFFFGENLIKNISAINVAEVARVDISSVSHLTVLRLFKLLDFNYIETLECGGCLHGHRGDIYLCQCKSTLVPFHGSVFCFHGATTKCHAGTSHTGMSSPRLLYWSENLTPVRNFATVSCKLEMTTRFGVKLVCWLTGMCGSKNYPYLPHGRNSSQASYIYLNFLAFENPPTPRNFQSLSLGEYGYFLELHNG